VPWRRGALTFLVTFIAICVFGASFAAGYARMHDGRVLPGVEVAGTSLAGLDRDAAAAELRGSLPALSSGTLVIEVDGVQQTVPYAAFDRDYDLELMLDQALTVGRGGSFVDQLQEQLRILLNGVTVQPQVTINSNELAREVAAMAYAAESAPVDATVTRVDGRYLVSPSAEGRDLDVEGAVAAALAAVDNTSPADTAITVQASAVQPSVLTADAQAAVDLAERVMAGSLRVSGADLTTEIPSEVLRGWVRLDESPAGGSWQLVIERGPIEQFVSNFAFETDIAPQNATFGFVSAEISVVPSAEGRATDIETTTNNIMAALEGRADGNPATDVALALAPVAPTFTTADAQAIAPRVSKISEWTTNYEASPLNGNGVNIEIPTNAIDGYVVEPGATFDFLQVIGPITSPPYTAGAAIRNGRTIMDGVLGGGMCSCSTTVFNAAMRAGLDMRARRNHSYYITRYPVGLDATVWIASRNSRQTMSFVNDLQYPILIRGINSPGAVTFQIFGVDDGRTVELSEPRIEREKKAVEFIEFTNELAPGVRKRTEFTVDGFWSWVTRTVRAANGTILHEDTFQSRYDTINGVIQVGRRPGDPPAGRRIPIDQYRARNNPAPPAE
jgi:vancomycin resistance protein YoaR